MKKKLIKIFITICLITLSFLYTFHLIFGDANIRFVTEHNSIIGYNKDIKKAFLQEMEVKEEDFSKITLNNIFNNYITSLSIGTAPLYMPRTALLEEVKRAKVDAKIKSETQVEKKINKSFALIFHNDTYLFIKKLSHSKSLYLWITILTIIAILYLIYLNRDLNYTVYEGAYIIFITGVLMTISIFCLAKVRFKGDILAFLLNMMFKEGINHISSLLPFYFIISLILFAVYLVTKKAKMTEEKAMEYREKQDFYSDEEIISKKFDKIMANKIVLIKKENEGYVVDNKHSLYKYEIVYVKESNTLEDKVYIFKYSDKIDLDKLRTYLKDVDLSDKDDKDYLIDIDLKDIKKKVYNKDAYLEIAGIFEEKNM